ncbi:LptF/LptG family permease [Aquibium sp. ELW1220]|jgi:lipopolysaccharide export system permease protein|uniref:LptF/LptG family permease n=1 Tax=Aquibium sp. ELW1220 TaxID=2976766 RepID=UPI0025B27E17|nr:LptF/LptG family permease [Aquibium sp. ELW1220]MDN2583076.1 LptF/LptG family permease [Aquibium sp. ELW1220]
MKLVERYIFLRALKVAAATLAIAVAIAWTTQVLGRINLVTDSGQTALTFLSLATLLLPTMIPVVAPFAVIIGATQALSSMNQDSELSVIAAAGAGRMTIIRPVMLLAVLMAIFSFAVDVVVEPAARQRVREIIATSHADLLSSVIQEGSFRRIEDGLYVQVSDRLPDGRLGGIVVADSREKDVDLLFYAKEGDIQHVDGGQVLLMRDGEVHRKAPGGDVSVIRFVSYAFDLSGFASKTGEIYFSPKDRSLAYLLDPPPNDRIVQRSPRLYTAEAHRVLSEWLYSIVFGLFALAAAGDVRSHREARIHPMVTAIAVALIARWQGYVVTDKVEESLDFVPWVYAMIAGNILFALYFILSGRAMTPPADWFGKIGGAFAALTGRRAEAVDAPGTVGGRP